jgi:hypothetical protein
MVRCTAVSVLVLGLIPFLGLTFILIRNATEESVNQDISKRITVIERDIEDPFLERKDIAMLNSEKPTGECRN